MLNEFAPWSSGFSGFVALNWALTLGCAAVFVAIYRHQRFLLVKTSMLVLAMTHLLFQWPLALYAAIYERWLPQPYAMVALVHGFVVAGLAASTVLLRPAAERCWLSVLASAHGGTLRRRAGIAILAVLCVVLAAIYAAYVPLRCTGLFVLFTDPQFAAPAREFSAKLLADPIPRYSLTLLAGSVVPLLTSLVAVELPADRARSRWRLVGLVLLLGCAWLLADLEGARGILVMLALVVAATILWQRGLRLPLAAMPLLLGLALVPAYALTLVFSVFPQNFHSEAPRACFAATAFNTAYSDSLPNAGLQPGDLPQVADNSDDASARQKPRGARNLVEQVGAVLFRAVIVPLEVGGWYVHYAQTHGPMGLGAVERLAQLMGRPIIKGPNVIGRLYGPLYYEHAVAPTISASAGYLFSNYGYLGFWAIPLNLVLLLLLDVSLLVYQRLADAFLLPVIATTTITALKFQESEYAAVWLTHGFGVVLVLGLALTVLTACRRSRAPLAAPAPRAGE